MNAKIKGIDARIQDAYVEELNLKITDPALNRKKDLASSVQFYGDIPLPSIVEISESRTCNRSCSFCPRSAPDFVDEKIFVKNELIDKLAQDLSTVNYSGLILFSGFVESLLDKNISRHVNTLKKMVPDSRIEMVTNGDPITIKNLNKLHKAGLDALLVSCYDGEHQITDISKDVEASDMPIDNVVFRNRWGTEEENFGISLSNRGGMMTSAEFSIANLNEPLDKPCFYPAYTFFMDYTGEVLMCAHDWGKKAIVGNLENNSFLDIWTSRRFSNWRQNLLKGNRKFKPCNVCNVDGTRMGIEHSEAWKASSENSS